MLEDPFQENIYNNSKMHVERSWKDACMIICNKIYSICMVLPTDIDTA